MGSKNKREQIIEAAKEIFLTKGIHKARVEDITNFLGIAKGSFYTYFKTKDMLLEEILDEVYKGRKEELEKILESDLGYKDKLEKFIIDRYVISSEKIKSTLILINLTKNFENLCPSVVEKFFKIQVLNRMALKKILMEVPDKNYTEKELQLLTLYMIGGIRNYILEKLFYKDMKEYFISSLEEFQTRIEQIELSNELKTLIELII